MEYAFRPTLTRIMVVLAVLAVFTGMAVAQGGSGELTGTVTDPAGAVVSNAQVTLTNTATGDKRVTTTTDAGVYSFPTLPVTGTYTIEAAPKGFRSVKIQNVIVSVGTITTQNIKLELGTSSEQVTVEAGAQLVQTEDASLSQLIDQRVWQSIPLESRSQNELINLVAGATPEAFNNTGRGASVNGTRSGTGNYLIEGADNNEQGQGGVALQGPGGANTTISPDAIQEYRVITNDFPAEYGKAGGFVTDTVLKSGTNQWHGSAFEYNRTQAITAQDWFSNNTTPVVRDHLVRNQFGGSLGGPVIKDKTFFYGTGEIHRLRQTTPTTATGTTQQFLDFVNSGAFETFMETSPFGACMVNTGAPCPGALNLSHSLGPIFTAARAKAPEAFPVANSTVTCNPAAGAANNPTNCVGAGLYTGGLVYPVPVYDTVTKGVAAVTDQARFSIKFDHKLSSKDQLGFTYLFDDVQFKDNNSAGGATIGPNEVVPSRAQNASLSWTRTISNTVLNQARFGYQRRVANFTSPDTVGIPFVNTAIDPLSTELGASPAIPQFFTENQFQYKDDLSITQGKHTVKTGFEYRRTRNGSSFFNDRFGTALGWSVEDDLTDLTLTDQLDKVVFGAPQFGSCALCSASIDPRSGNLPDYYRGYRANEFAVYGQDDWRFSSRLTFNLGLRWEYFGPPSNFNPALDSNFYFGPPTTPIRVSSNPFFPANNPVYAEEATATFQTRHPVWKQDMNNFGPRFGFSWDPMGNQKMVVRGGFGLMYDRIYNNLFENIRFNPPFFADTNFGFLGGNGAPAGALSTPGFYALPFVANTNGSLISPTLFPNGLPKPSPRHMDQNLNTPYYEQMHFGIQYEVRKDMVLDVSYVGTLGRELTGIVNRNTFDGRTACNAPPYAAGTPCAAAGFAGGFSSKRVNTTIGSDNFRTNGFTSNYSGLQVSLRKRYAMGLQFTANYTYSKTLDELSDNFRAKNVGALNACAVEDCSNLHLNYGPADFDVRHRFVSSFNYDLPFARTNRWLGGFQVNGILSWQTGVPVPVYDPGTDSNKDGLFGSDRPEYASGFSAGNAVQSRSAGMGYLKPLAFTPTTCPANVNLGLWCNSTMGRNDIYGPHYVSLDFGLGKSFKITESSKVTFFANFFNIFNHPNFDTPNGNFTDPNFGKAQATLGNDGINNGHRIGQLALRFDF